MIYSKMFTIYNYLYSYFKIYSINSMANAIHIIILTFWCVRNNRVTQFTISYNKYIVIYVIYVIYSSLFQLFWQISFTFIKLFTFSRINNVLETIEWPNLPFYTITVTVELFILLF